MPLVKVKDKAQITLPAKLRRALHIQEGDYLEAKLEGNTVVLVPQKITARFPTVELSEQGEAMLEESLEDVRAGRVREFEDMESLVAELRDEAGLD
jgi:AbrB family looped-hinge helix DNA binding protein